MEDDAGPVPVQQGLLEAHIHEHRAVEGVGVCLVDNVDAVVEPLLVEHKVEVPQEDGQLALSAPVGHHHCHLVQGGAVGGSPLATCLNPGQLLNNIGGKRWRVRRPLSPGGMMGHGGRGSRLKDK